jgi:hypothetical protein
MLPREFTPQQVNVAVVNTPAKPPGAAAAGRRGRGRGGRARARSPADAEAGARAGCAVLPGPQSRSCVRP